MTQSHPDHVGGVRGVRERLGTAGCTLRKVPWSGHDGPTPVEPIADGDALVIDGETTLRALHTPGHAPDHVCWLLEEEGALFSGDTILGAGTVVVPIDGGDMSEYLSSLRRLQSLPTTMRSICPGHGPRICAAHDAITSYIEHRLAREGQILAVLRARPTEDLSASQLVDALYKDRRLAGPLYQAATETVHNHLVKLGVGGLAVRREGAGRRSGGTS